MQQHLVHSTGDSFLVLSNHEHGSWLNVQAIAIDLCIKSKDDDRYSAAAFFDSSYIANILEQKNSKIRKAREKKGGLVIMRVAAVAERQLVEQQH